MATTLGAIAEGSIVYIDESAARVAYYVAKHNYESGLNGSGRTLLRRKATYGDYVWSSANVNAYASSDVDSLLNGTFKSGLSVVIRNAISGTKFYYTPGNKNNSLTTLQRDVFILSLTELGLSSGSENVEGSALPISSSLRDNGQWTRSPYATGSNASQVQCIGNFGGASTNSANRTFGVFPCFTLPDTMQVDDGGNVTEPKPAATSLANIDGTSVLLTGCIANVGGVECAVPYALVNVGGVEYTVPFDMEPEYSEILSENEPKVIARAAIDGIAPDLWDVGDTIGIALNGTVGALTFSNETYYAFILGFDHNSTIEGTGTIHFQVAKTAAGVDIAFCDSRYGNNSSSDAFRMNTSNVNSGGWNGSYMRNTICPAFLSVMPTTWQTVIAACTKYSDNTAGGTNTASYVTATSDKIWLMSEYEVQGARTYANSAEQNYQKQYDYYKNGNSKVKYKHNATTTACNWWLRSARAIYNHAFCSVTAGGAPNGYGAQYAYGFAPGFVLGNAA